ncbi:unnamed protein product [Dracunculus medinensis]|uniref:Uncharacterized protein n=1 Tax=Dracunculus medinensis TaxID=318479 RepID=A0A0N4UHV4_DRAME|nr:unnamed protein product [Dracunculus medinensis]
MLRRIHLTMIGAIIICVIVDLTDEQALNDPITQYIEGRLGNRRIFWCPSGYGYLPYCPQPTDWDNYNWCCTWPYMGSWKPSCCAFAIPTGALIAIIIAAIILIAGEWFILFFKISISAKIC